MARLNVKLEYGLSCDGISHASNDVIDIEVNDEELNALRNLGTDKISCASVVKTIKNGETTLQSLHKQLEEKFYYMVEEYWLYEAYNEFLQESLSEAIEKDISNGIYTPTILEEESDFDCFGKSWIDVDENECQDDEEDCDDCEDDEDDADADDDVKYDMDEYYSWVCEHDHEFVAERVGLNIEVCREDEANYTIFLNNQG